MDTQAILHKLFAIYQPGGNADRGNLLRSLTEVKCGHSIQDTLSAIRMWRRWLCRAEELHIGIPDSMVLIQALSKIAENLTKHAGSQVGFRIAAARQELEVDRRPTLATTKEFAEFLQAEAEDLAFAALTMPQLSSTKTTSPAAGTQPAGGAEPTIKKPKQACRYWGTSAGCKRGESCTVAHSKTDRCFHCSGENHFAKDCPYGRDRPGKDGKKTAKLKGGGKPQAEKTEETSKSGTSSTTPTTPTSLASSAT